MTQIIKSKCRNEIRFLVLLMAGVVCWGGCSKGSSKDDEDRHLLDGWKMTGDSQMPKAVLDDYKGYFNALPSDEQHSLNGYSTMFFINGTGGHGVLIQIALKGVYHDHILIYDTNNVRIKMGRFEAGHFAS